MLPRLLLSFIGLWSARLNCGRAAQGHAPAAQASSTVAPAGQPSPSPIPVPAVPRAATPLISIPASAVHVQRIDLMRKYPPDNPDTGQGRKLGVTSVMPI